MPDPQAARWRRNTGVSPAHTRERQFIQRMNPVRPQIVELPISVSVTLLQGIIGTHAQIEGNDVGLNVRKMIEYTWQATAFPSAVKTWCAVMAAKNSLL